jgi:hypothetical protein
VQNKLDTVGVNSLPNSNRIQVFAKIIGNGFGVAPVFCRDNFFDGGCLYRCRSLP